MKKINSINPYLICIIIVLCSCFTATSQNEKQCGTLTTPESDKYFKNSLPEVRQFEEEYYQKALQRSSTALSNVPVKIHVLRNDDGTGGLSESTINTIISDMNEFYSNAFLEFFICDGINYIDNSDYFDFSTDEQNALTMSNNVSNIINIYFANSVSTTNGGGLCGYTFSPGGPEIILMDNSCALNGSTMPHEMGHFFGLAHTHGTTNGSLTTELVDGSNCDTDGDFICDTPADPQLGFGNVSSSCNYFGDDTDANGDTFSPNPSNIMSYSRKSCRTEFSNQQYARIYGVYQTSRSEMLCSNFNIDFAANYTRDCEDDTDVSFTDNSIGATTWEWDINGDDIIDYTSQNPIHNYSEAGEYDVTLTITNGSESITKVYPNFIKIGGEVTSTSQITLTLETDNWPAETSWVFTNLNTGVEIISPQYIEGNDDFTIFTETFNTEADGCYTFEITDSYGDGICCSSGNGSYVLESLEGDIIASGGDFGAGEITYVSNTNTTLTVDDYFQSNNIFIYPNPTTSALYINIEDSNDLPDSIVIYNMLGQIIKRYDVTQIGDLSINTNALSNGVYYLELTKENSSTTISFIKN